MNARHAALTRSSFLWSRILRTPLWALYGMLPFFLFRDLHASTLQIAVMVALKPSVSILSMYWASWVDRRPDRLVGNICLATFLSVIPFFFFPFVSNPWFFVFAFGMYMLLHRGTIPAWMEVMKRNLPDSIREKTFAFGSTIGYLGDGIVPIVFGWVLDGYQDSWRWIFPSFALFSLPSLYFQWRIPLYVSGEGEEESSSLSRPFASPWKNAKNLLVKRPDFCAFQIGFMFGGAGLMVMHAVLPAYFICSLELSYTELALALALCKGVGYALTSHAWADYMPKVNIFHFGSHVSGFAFLFAIALLLGQMHIMWVYIAYLCYGVMQAGSELCWNLSGPVFSGSEDSALYSSVNVVSVGLRGCIAPAIGALLASLFGTPPVLVVGGALCLLGTLSMRFYTRQYRAAFEAN